MSRSAAEPCKHNAYDTAGIHEHTSMMSNKSTMFDQTSNVSAGSMTGITEYDVEGCEKYGALPDGSSSWYLLRIWASKGYSIVDLFNLFAITKMVRCMQIMKEHGENALQVT